MTTIKSTIPADFSLPADFKIEVNGFIDEHFTEYFDGYIITHKRFNNNKVISCLSGEVLDQAALIGIINLLYDMRFPIISVKTTKPRKKIKKISS